eukprot:gene14000-biopygen17063
MPKQRLRCQSDGFGAKANASAKSVASVQKRWLWCQSDGFDAKAIVSGRSDGYRAEAMVSVPKRWLRCQSDGFGAKAIQSDRFDAKDMVSMPNTEAFASAQKPSLRQQDHESIALAPKQSLWHRKYHFRRNHRFGTETIALAPKPSLWH